MMYRRFALYFATTAACLGSALATTPAAAIGYYNLPGNFCQCLGYGNGAGYHSCLVLGPITPHGCRDTNEVRLACPPRPSYDYYGGGYYGAPPYHPSMSPTPVPYRPAPDAMRPQVLR